MKKNRLLIDNLRTHIFQSLENLEELLEQEDINLRTLRIKELEISFTVTRRTKSEYLKSLDFWYNPLTTKNIKYPYRNENPTTNPSNPIYLVIINPQG